MAPEFISTGTITLKTDIFSLGVIIIEVLMGCRECPSVDKVIIIYIVFEHNCYFFFSSTNLFDATNRPASAS